MNRYVKGGIGVGVGAVGGVASTIAANMDAKNMADFAAKNPGKVLNPIKRIGTWVNYVVPVVEVGLVGFDVIKDAFAQGVLTAQAGGLAASKATAYFTRKNYVLTYVATPAPWTAEMAAAAQRAAQQDIYRQRPNPQPIKTGPLVPNVQPQDLAMGMGIGATG